MSGGVGPLVSSAVGALSTFLIEEAKFLGAVRGQVEEMKTELTRMQSFLVDADRRRNGGDTIVANLVVEIRELAYDAEEVVATFVVKAVASDGGRPPPSVSFDFKRYFRFVKTSSTRHVTGTQIQEINSKIAGLTRSLQTYKVLEQAATATNSNSRMRYSTVVEENTVVGLEDHVKTVVAYLIDKTHSRVVSVSGMGGLGKTTFAKEIHRHGVIKRYFDHIALVCVSQQCNPNQVWRDVLLQFADSEEQKKRIRKLTPGELVRELESLQMEKKCLVVLDDIWEQRDWTSLNDAFPRATTTGSKIVLTTRNQLVVSHDDIQCFPYNVPLLQKEECLELLQKKLSRNGQEFKMCTEKKTVMEGIIKHCGGLPLAIVLVSGVLAEDSSLEGCEKVRQDLSNSLNKGNSRSEGISDVLALSYQDLPYHLKACFLYLSLFPEDLEIEAKRLVQMWIAEGFVSAAATREGTTKTMLDVGLSYLNELVNRCIVQADITKFSKRVRSCRLHDLMRDFCRSKALEENFFAEFGLQQSICSASSLNRIRRLAVHSKPVTTTSTVPRGQQYQHVRSCVVCWAMDDEVMDPWDMINSLLKGFKFLKVFNMCGFHYKRHPGVLSGDIGKLIHLRYLSVPEGCQLLPPALGNLVLLQTLDLRRVTSNIYVPDVLWKLKELRHLYLPAHDYILGSIYRLRLDGLSKLETLVEFDTYRSEVGDLYTLSNLRKVCVTCKVKELDKILESPVFSKSNSLLRRSDFMIHEAAETEEEHVLIRLVSASPRVRTLFLIGRVYEETFLHNLNANISSLSLGVCGLKEDPMSALQKMPNLRKLILFEGSYIGKKMVCLAPKRTMTVEATSTSTED